MLIRVPGGWPYPVDQIDRPTERSLKNNSASGGIPAVAGHHDKAFALSANEEKHAESNFPDTRIRTSSVRIRAILILRQTGRISLQRVLRHDLAGLVRAGSPW
ncbi:MAG: hypothetical protein P9E24_03620 [Candidatus Competibacter sp.]|nr:hypothetical protein [Candidatus Competibacter sp.]MDG4584910.1 hypothetical protein [Candidatus Competibacter sp.]